MKTVDVRKAVPTMPGASDEYRAARERLRASEVAMRDHIEAVADMRRQLPLGPPVRNYAFFERDSRVTLADLFAPGKPELIVYHLMYWADEDEFCPMCSMWIDGLDAVAAHVERRANFAVATRAPVRRLEEWARQRGWRRARLLSDDGPDFARDTGAEDAKGDPVETVLVFSKRGSEIRHTYTSHAVTFGEGRGIDLLSPVWHLFDLLPSGRDDWHPDNDYMTRSAANSR